MPCEGCQEQPGTDGAPGVVPGRGQQLLLGDVPGMAQPQGWIFGIAALYLG